MFATKYPTFTALMQIVATAAQDLVASGETALQKIEGLAVIIPQIIGFIPNVGLLSTELSALKASPADIEAGAELLITDLAFSNGKAKSVIAAAFPVAEGLVALYPQMTALVAAIKA